MSEPTKARKPKKLDYLKATVLSIIVAAAVTYSNQHLIPKFNSQPPKIYVNEAIIGSWNELSGKQNMEFNTKGFCQVEKVKKPMLFIKTKDNSFTLFKMGRDKKGNKLGSIAHQLKVVDDKTFNMGEATYNKLVTQK
ncbi:hypothetical protein PQO03_15470 [Lentisphaera profundi]|uniref:Lipocalin-like domain-containing protein n=1 Tax=Lentisphaera profundi TaxID=1658616 RepID=A0ABY7W2P0_9BACT|nr:hypothetical protein [Lentisphaera profundi]WDE99234.1 hypothetical protein PQO03_15470 [Lentisphaera profundi]